MRYRKFLILAITMVCTLNLMACENRQPNVQVIPIDTKNSDQQTKELKQKTQEAMMAVKDYFGFRKTIDLQVFIQDGQISQSDNTGITFDTKIVMSGQAPVVHETTHYLMAQEPSIGMNSKFFEEGISVMIQELYSTDIVFPFKFYRLKTHKKLSVEDIMKKLGKEYIPLEEIIEHNEYFDASMNSDNKNMSIRRYSYIEAGSFFLYLNERYGKKKLLELYSSSTSLDFSGVYGKSIKVLEQEFMTYYHLQ